MTNGRRPRSARLRAHIRGNLVGYVALFLALNLGTAWALERNSVTSKHIAKGQVKAADLAANAVGGKTVEDGSLTSADLDDSALAAGPDLQVGKVLRERTARRAKPDRPALRTRLSRSWTS